MVINGRGAGKKPAPRFAALNKYYKSEAWKIKREIYYARYGKYCKACNSRKDIQLHHMSYEFFTREPLSDLVSLCKTCHDEVTQLCRRSGHRDDRLTTLQFISRKRKRT